MTMRSNPWRRLASALALCVLLPSAARAQEEAAEGRPRARLRVVNAYLDPAGEPAALDVHAGMRGDAPVLIGALASGSASEWVEVAAGRTSLLVTPAGKTGEDDVLGDQSVRLDEGEAAVVLMARGAPTMEGHAAVAFKVYVDDPLAEVPADRALLIGDVLAMQTVGEGPATFELARLEAGCLRKLRDEDRTSPISGTFAVPYVVAPGAIEVVAHRAADAGCRGAPASSAANVTVGGGERWLVFVHPGAKGAIAVLPVRTRPPPAVGAP